MTSRDREPPLARARGVEHIERLAGWLDDLVRVPGTRFRVGLDPLLGLVPGLGDAVAGAMAVVILAQAVRLRVPSIVVARMALNTVFDVLISAIPVVGDAADFVVKSNRWNLALLRRHAGGARKAGAADYAIVFGAIALVAAVLIGTVVVTAVAARWVARRVGLGT